MIALPPQPDLDLASLVRTIPDFPKPGIQFRDITTLIGDAAGFSESVRRLAARAAAYRPDFIVAVEARGFLFGAAMATALGIGLVPVRKAGKLPGVTIGVDYELEYGTDRLELHEGAVLPGHRVVLVDDLLATGGTMAAAVRLLEQVGGVVPAAACVIELTFLEGRKKLDVPVETLLTYDS